MRHCILVKWNASVTDKAATAQAAEKVFAPVKEMEGVEGIAFLPNVVDRPNRYDLLIRIEMTLEALPAYDASAAHKQWKDEFGGLIESKVIFDYQE